MKKLKNLSENLGWYKIIEDEHNLYQGDFIYNCPIVIPSKLFKEPGQISAEAELYNVIVMSQSCDLVGKKIKLVLMCPFWTLQEFGDKNNRYQTDDGKEELRRGYTIGYHLLNKCNLKGFENDYLVVDFRSTYSLPIKFIMYFAKEQKIRKSLASPYKEHLSQAYARFFMRVGLPSDIPAFAKYPALAEEF